MSDFYCQDCGVPVDPSGEPATTSGWYGCVRFEWRNGQLVSTDAACAKCKVRRTWTPTRDGHDFVVDALAERDADGWCLAPFGRFYGRAAAMDAIHAYALANGRAS